MSFIVLKRPQNRLRYKLRAARLGCFIQGFAVSCWAPLIPFIEETLSLGTQKITYIILGFGLGSVLGMLGAGFFTERLGPKIVFAISSFTIILTIIGLGQIINFPVELALVVFFGMGVGSLDVWGSIYGAYLEKHYRAKVLGPLYALYSLGEFSGAGVIVLMMTLKLEIKEAIPAVFFIIAIAALWYLPCIDKDLVQKTPSKPKFYLLPKGEVIALSLIVAIIFMAGGAMVDWSGLYLNEKTQISLKYAALGYILLSVAMFVCRIYSNKLLKLIGEFNALLGGALLCAIGLMGIIASPSFTLSLVFFILTGIGMSNITPLCVRACTKQNSMPMVAAVATLSIMGYGALLLGPALLGFCANQIGLTAVFVLLALLCLISAAIALKTRKLLS